MARLYKHGDLIGTIERLSSITAYYADGTILRKTTGVNGWKDVTPKNINRENINLAFAIRREARAEWEKDHPQVAALHRAMMDAAPMSWRWKLIECVRIMPNDPDGIWSTLTDDNHNVDIDDLVAISRLHLAAEEAERKGKTE